jgi:hypothetical protein
MMKRIKMQALAGRVVMALTMAGWGVERSEAVVSDWVGVIKAVGSEGRGNAAAGEAWRQLSGAGSETIPEILAAMDGANVLAKNYLRSAVDVIAERELSGGGGLGVDVLTTYLSDTAHDARSRELAFELIERVDADAAAELVPGFASDPSTVLRRKAVLLLVMKAASERDAGKTEAAIARYREALDAARDIDQIQSITKELGDLGEEVDLPEQFGFLMYWSVIGPFDNVEKVGFDSVYPPEEEVDLKATYEGKAGPVEWSELTSSDESGMVDINKAYGPQKGVVAYAFTEFTSPKAQDVELRLGCKNAWKIWLNGELVFGRDEYHRGIRIDQYRLPVSMKEGANTILIKLCQDEQEQDWTVEWQFQMRVCDETGTAVLAPDRKPTPEPEAPTRRRRAE